MAETIVKMSSDEQKLWQGLQRVVDQQKKVDDGFKKIGSSSKRAGKTATDETKRAGKEAMTLSRQIDAVGARYMTWSAALGAATSAMRALHAEQQRLAEGQSAAEGGLAKLATLPGGESEFLRRTALARRFFGQGSAATLGEAGGLVFSLESAGATKDDADLFARVGSAKLVDNVAEFAASANTLIKTLGTKETGGFRELVNKSFAASAVSPSLPDAILAASARAGKTGASLGVSDEEIIASTALISAQTGSADVAGTQVASFARSLSKDPTLFKGSLRSSADALRGLDGGQLFDKLGRSEAVEAVRGILAAVDTGEFQSTMRSMKNAADANVVEQKINVAQLDPTVNAARGARVARAQSELAGEREGQMSLLLDEVFERRIARDREAGRGGLDVITMRAVQETARMVLGAENTLRMTSALGNADERADATAALNRAAAALERAAGSPALDSRVNDARREHTMATGVE